MSTCTTTSRADTRHIIIVGQIRSLSKSTHTHTQTYIHNIRTRVFENLRTRQKSGRRSDLLLICLRASSAAGMIPSEVYTSFKAGTNPWMKRFWGFVQPSVTEWLIRGCRRRQSERRRTLPAAIIFGTEGGTRT